MHWHPAKLMPLHFFRVLEQRCLHNQQEVMRRDSHSCLMQDVTEVVDTCHQAGISKKCVKLKPIAVIKG